MMAKMDRRFVVLMLTETRGQFVEITLKGVTSFANHQDALRWIKKSGRKGATYQVAEFKGKPQRCDVVTHEQRVLSDAVEPKAD